MSEFSLSRRLAAEALGTMLLVATVVGSGIMADKLSGGNVALTSLNTNACYGVMVHSDVAGVPQAGSVRFSTSRGAMYPNCASIL